MDGGCIVRRSKWRIPMTEPRPTTCPYHRRFFLALLLAWLFTGPASAVWERPGGSDPRAGQCLLLARYPAFDDGYGDTPVRLELSATRLRLVTESNLDTTLGPLGVSVDGGALFVADRLEGTTDLIFEKDVNAIIDAFKRGSTARVILRFWPTWPQTGDKILEVSLKGFTNAFDGLSTCS